MRDRPVSAARVSGSSRILGGLLIVTLVGAGVGAVLSRLPQALSPNRNAATDFTQDYLSARSWGDGGDPYAPLDDLHRRYLGPNVPSPGRTERTPHPPALIALYGPVAEIPFTGARVAWLATSAMLLAGATFVFVRAIGLGLWVSIAVTGAMLAVPITQKDLAQGQSNGVLLAAIVGGWLLLRTRRDVRGGALLGIAAGLKLFPLLLVLPLLRERRLKAAAGLLASFIGCGLIGMGLLGADATVDFATDVAPENSRFWIGAPMNLSLTAIPVRWLGASEWFQPTVDLTVVASVIAGILMIGVMVGAFTSGGRLTGDRVWSALPWMLLASPLTWEFSLTLMIPTLILALVQVTRARGLPTPTLLIVSAILLVGIPPGLPLPERTGVLAQALGYALPTYALLAYALLDHGAWMGWRLVEPRDAGGYSSTMRSSTNFSSTIPPTGSNR